MDMFIKERLEKIYVILGKRRAETHRLAEEHPDDPFLPKTEKDINTLLTELGEMLYDAERGGILEDHAHVTDQVLSGYDWEKIHFSEDLSMDGVADVAEKLESSGASCIGRYKDVLFDPKNIEDWNKVIDLIEKDGRTGDIFFYISGRNPRHAEELFKYIKRKFSGVDVERGESLMKSHAGYISFEAYVTNPEGLHARTAVQLMRVAQEYRGQVFVKKGDMEVNGKSVIDLLFLAATPGTRLEIKFEPGYGDPAPFYERMQTILSNGYI